MFWVGQVPTTSGNRVAVRLAEAGPRMKLPLSSFGFRSQGGFPGSLGRMSTVVVGTP